MIFFNGDVVRFLNRSGGAKTSDQTRRGHSYQTLRAALFSSLKMGVFTLLFMIGSGLNAQAEDMDDEPPEESNADVYALTEYESLLPKVDLSSNLMSTILSAELSVKSGDWGAGYQVYMTLDKQYGDPRLAKRATEIALSANQLLPAITAAKLWVVQSPPLEPYHEKAETTLMRLHLQAGQYTQATPMLRSRLRLMRFDEAPLSRLFDEILTTSDKKGMLVFLQKELAAYKKYADINIVLTRAALLAEKHDLALSYAQKVIEIEPESERSILLFTQLSMDKPRVLKLLKDAVKKNPNNEKIRSSYAQTLIADRQYLAAREQYLVLLDQNPKQSRYLYILGLASIDAQQPQEAVEYLKKFLATDKKDIDESYVLQAQGVLAELYAKQGNYQAALEVWGEPPNEIAALARISRRAYFLAQTGKVKEARTLIRNVPVANDDELKQRLLSETQFLSEFKEYAQALKIFQESETKFATDPDMIYEFSLAADLANQLPLMEKKLRLLIQLQPDDYRGYNGLGYVLADRNIRLPEAQQLLVKALELAPENAFVLDSFGWLQFRQGDFVSAEKTLRKAYQIRSEGDIALHLVEVLWMSNRKELARDLLRQLNVDFVKSNPFKELTKRLNIDL